MPLGMGVDARREEARFIGPPFQRIQKPLKEAKWKESHRKIPVLMVGQSPPAARLPLPTTLKAWTLLSCTKFTLLYSKVLSVDFYSKLFKISPTFLQEAWHPSTRAQPPPGSSVTRYACVLSASWGLVGLSILPSAIYRGVKREPSYCAGDLRSP